jgi:YidC/Oxa1 family membrane protein insertase
MENFQRYFLIACVFIMSYFLVIRWEPPTANTVFNDDLNEVSTYSPNEDFGFIDESIQNEPEEVISDSLTTSCASTPFYEIDSSNWKISINLKDGSLDKAELKKYPDEIGSGKNKFMFNACGRNEYSQLSGFVFGKNADQDFSSFKIEDITKIPNGNRYTFSRESSTIKESKTISFNPENYFVEIKHVIKNLSSEVINSSSYSKIERNSLKPPGTEDAFFGDPANFAYLGPVFSTESDNYQKINLGELEQSDFKENSIKGWTAFLEHYFLTAIIPDQENINVFVGKKNKTNERFSVGFVGRPIKIQPYEETSFTYSLYFGPKVQSELSKANKELPLAVDYGFLYWIGQPMFLAMQFFFDLVGNWGWAIILVTLLIKVILWPLSYVSYKSMGKMRQIQPQLKDIQERHSGDRQAMSQAMMKLYKDEKVNPALGCLPMLLQMPFFLAFYWVLIETVELRYAPFLVWITDLSSRDPLFILPILNIGAMWAMQMLQPQPAGIDPMQAKIFKFMPLIFGVMFAFFPAGLVLYWLINSLVSAIQMLMHSPRSA